MAGALITPTIVRVCGLPTRPRARVGSCGAMPAVDRRAAAVQTWERLAARYRVQTRLELRAARVAAALAAPTAGDRVLDVATGSGAMLDALLERPDRPRS